MGKHTGKPNPSAAKLLATMTSVNGVLDVNKSVFAERADYVKIYNSLGSVPYDPAGPIFRFDQPTNPALPFPPSPYLTNLWPKVTLGSPIPDDMRIVIPTNYMDTSAGAPYKTDAIFSATITYFPDNSFLTDPAGNPITMPAYFLELS
jgi:hypothetical protein